MEFLFTLESLGLSFMEIRLGANGIGAWISEKTADIKHNFF